MLRHSAAEWFSVTPGQADVLIYHDSQPAFAATFSFTLCLDGPLDVPRWRDAVHLAVAHFECLRLEFRRDPDADRFEQRVSPFDSAVIRLDLLNVGDVDDVTATLYCERLLRRDASEWHLWTEPVYRFRLVRQTDVKHRFLLSIQHAVVDAYSLDNIVRYLVAAYRDPSGTGDPVPSLRDAVDALVPRDRTVERDLAYWRRVVLPRPSDDAEPVGIPLELASADVDVEAWATVRTRLAAAGTSLSAWLLDRFCTFADGDTPAITVDTHFQLRSRRFPDVAGNFAVVRPVVIRRDVENSLGRVTEALLAAQLHQRVDSAALRRLEGSHGSPHREWPDFNYVPFNHSRTAIPALRNELTIRQDYFVPPRRVYFRRVLLSVRESERCVQIRLWYDPARYPVAAAAHFLSELT